MSWASHVTVAVVVERDGRFLLVEESAGQSGLVYNQPAGHVEKGETLEAAACREALEETGWEVSIERLLGLYVLPSPANPDVTYYRACFIAQALKHHPERSLDEGIAQALWLSPEELAASGRARSPLVNRCIADYLAGKSYPLELIYEHR